MSTNYYARLALGGSNSAATTVSIHIGKTSGGAILSGDWFSSFKEWKNFLSYNADKVDIFDEYKTPLTFDELVERFEKYDSEERARQFNWLKENLPSSMSSHWLDEDGFTFSKGEFF